MTAKKRIKSKVDANAVSVESTALLGLLADIRAAVGDPTGKLMQDELVEHCRKLTHSADWNRRRVDMLVPFHAVLGEKYLDNQRSQSKGYQDG